MLIFSETSQTVNQNSAPICLLASISSTSLKVYTWSSSLTWQEGLLVAKTENQTANLQTRSRSSVSFGASADNEKQCVELSGASRFRNIQEWTWLALLKSLDFMKPRMWFMYLMLEWRLWDGMLTESYSEQHSTRSFFFTFYFFLSSVLFFCFRFFSCLSCLALWYGIIAGVGRGSLLTTTSTTLEEKDSYSNSFGT